MLEFQMYHRDKSAWIRLTSSTSSHHVSGDEDKMSSNNGTLSVQWPSYSHSNEHNQAVYYNVTSTYNFCFEHTILCDKKAAKLRGWFSYH